MKITLISTSTFPADQGLRTLSACLKRAGYNTKMMFLPYSEDYSHVYPEEVLEQVKQASKDSGLIGLNAMASTSSRAVQLIAMFKTMNIPVIWGGPHPTFFPKECFKQCDIICIGEAEEVFIELAGKIEKKQDITSIRNLWVRNDGKEYKNDVRPAPIDLDVLAHPDYDIEDHLILENDKLMPFEERHIGGMIFFQTQRGCPLACSYCTNHIMHELYKGKSPILRTHSVDYVIEELSRLKNKFKSIQVFDIRDETFLVRPLPWIREFSEKYKNHVNIRFKCLAEPASLSAEGISEEKIRLLVDAGLTDIIVGIQSGSDNINFNVYKRYIKAEQVIKCAEVLNKFNGKLAVMYDVMTCNPYEGKEDVLATINLIRKLPKSFYLSVNNLIFFEGTPLYERALRDGIIKDGKDSASDLNYWDRWKHIKLKKKNAYLNLILNMMRGKVTKTRYGSIPAKLLDKLVSGKSIDFNYKHMFFTSLAGNFVQAADFTRENIAKPIYRSMPVSFKLWYDKVRYKA
ncbi:B12-binding domain-containing radical SAM protein [Candidatus Woesearchaeota archaeon]|nr:B12-binding domain-containing radical SAM protein [Candidatus Woesearchaeota archaeon]